jgi:hypothetical protein
MAEDGKDVKKTTILLWLRLALGGAIVGVSIAGVVSPGQGSDLVGAAVGGLSTAALLKLLHLV